MMSEHQSDPPSSSSRTLSPSNSPYGQIAHITKKKRIDYKEEIARAVLDSEYDNELGTFNQPIGGVQIRFHQTKKVKRLRLRWRLAGQDPVIRLSPPRETARRGEVSSR